MNNHINDKNYIPLTPFKGWVLENFPFIEANFDAITNYELLCLIVKYLNEVISNQNQVQELGTELVTAYNQLLDYVNNYFNNLDVQEEINNKLDAMAQDGSLTNLIKNYVDPLIEEQNNRIDEIDTKVNSVASGSPKGVYATVSALETADPNHDYIYVVTATGNWYYYSNGSWVSGGTYQSTRIDDNSITYNMLDNSLQNGIIPNDTTTEDYTLTGAYYNGSVGNAISTTTLNNAKGGVMNVKQGDVIIAPYFPQDLGFGSVKPIILTDANDIIIERHEYSEFFDTTTNLPKDFKLTIPSGVSKLYFNTTFNSSRKAIWYPYKINGYNYDDSRINSQLNVKEEIETSNIFNDLVYNIYNWGVTLANYSTYVYDVQALDKINVITTLGANKQFIAGVFVDNNGKPCNIIPIIGVNGSNTPVDTDVIVPAGAKKLYISGSNSLITTTHIYKYSFSANETSNKKLSVNYVNNSLTITNQNNGNYLNFLNFGGNNLFMIKNYKVGSITKTLVTDMTPAPYIVNAVNNPNGDRTTTSFTGGNHQWNDGYSGSTPTAEQISLEVYVDGTLKQNNSDISYGDNVTIIETNRVQASNTCLQAGGGRNVLEEKIVFNFDGETLDVINTIKALEAINILRYYGIQGAGLNNSDYKIYSDKIVDYTGISSITKKPDMIFGSDIIRTELDNEGLGNYQYNTSNYKVIVASGKSYYCPIYGNCNLNTNEEVFIHGRYIFKDNQI